MEEKKIKLSIIVPVYNVELYLKECLDSLINQDLPKDEYEIILVNDGSKDSSWEIAKEFAAMHSNIVLLTQENQGQAVARNLGVEESSGEYLFFVDSDDYLERNVLKTLYNEASHHYNDILFFNFKLQYERNEQKHSRTFPLLERDKDYTGEELTLSINDFGSLWKCIYRRDLLINNNIRMIPGIYHEDSDFNMRMYPLANKVRIIDLSVYNYRCFGESSTRTKDISKIQLDLYSNFVVYNDIREFIKSQELSKNVRRSYHKRINSIMVSAILQLFRLKKTYGTKFVNKCLYYIKENKLLPIKGRTNSWKTTMIIPIINTAMYFYRKK